MAGLDPAIPLSEARPCHIIGIAGSSPAMTANRSISSEHALRAKVGDFSAKIMLQIKLLSASDSTAIGLALGKNAAGGAGRVSLYRRDCLVSASGTTIFCRLDVQNQGIIGAPNR
jgi:hypothetical protein